MPTDQDANETDHSIACDNRFECGECGNSVWVVVYGEDVPRHPQVECGNIGCDGGRMVLCD